MSNAFRRLPRLCLCRVVFWRRTGFIRRCRCTGYLDSRHLTRLDRATFPMVNIAATLGAHSCCSAADAKGRQSTGQREGDLDLWILDRYSTTLVSISYYSDNYSCNYFSRRTRYRITFALRDQIHLTDLEKYQGSFTGDNHQQQISPNQR